MSLGIFKLTGKIVLNSPLMIGSGEGEYSDIDVMRDSDGKPFIPASSFIGAIKSNIEDKYDYELTKKTWDSIWGFTSNQEAKASSIFCSDLFLSGNSAPTEIRDGIAIDPKTGIVYDKQKYDYELVTKGAQFNLKIEAHYDENKEIVKNLISLIKKELSEMDSFRFGAKTNNGFGKVKLKGGRLIDFDFSDIKNLKSYLLDSDAQLVSENEVTGFTKRKNEFKAELDLRIKTSFTQRSYPDNPDAPDSTSIKSGNDYIMTGSGAKGAIRNRALKIVNTLLNDNSEEPGFIKNLFGHVTKADGNDRQHEEKSAKGKVRIEEAKIKNHIDEVLNRIAIDRFTGGTMKTALFDSMVLFYKSIGQDPDSQSNLKLEITINNCTDAEAGLILLVIKDIWTGDLAFGGDKNVGRGVFTGIEGKIKFRNTDIKITHKDASQIGALQNYVDSLLTELGVKNE